MKKILSFTLLILTLNCIGQQTQTKVLDFNAYVHLPASYNSNPLVKYPVIVFFPGLGEVGTNASLVIANGPGAYIAQGWNGNVTVNGSTTEFIVISLQPASAWPPQAYVDTYINSILSTYRCSNLFLTGLSMGGWVSSMYVSAGTLYKKVTAIATYCGVNASDNQPFPQGFDAFALNGGKFLCVEQVNDGRYMNVATDEMNKIKAGSGIHITTNYGDGGHDNWNQFYGGQGVVPQKYNGLNVYEWFASLLTQVVVAPPVVITPAISAVDTIKAKIGVPVNFQFTIKNNPTAVSIFPPNGLSINTSGLLTGIPTNAYTSLVQMSANNSAGNTISSFILQVSDVVKPKTELFRQVITYTTNTGCNTTIIYYSDGTYVKFNY